MFIKTYYGFISAKLINEKCDKCGILFIWKWIYTDQSSRQTYNNTYCALCNWLETGTWSIKEEWRKLLLKEQYKTADEDIKEKIASIILSQANKNL